MNASLPETVSPNNSILPSLLEDSETESPDYALSLSDIESILG